MRATGVKKKGNMKGVLEVLMYETQLKMCGSLACLGAFKVVLLHFSFLFSFFSLFVCLFVFQ